MIRQFFKDSFLYGLASIFIQGIPILILPVYVRLLPPSDYGAMEIILIFAVLINLTVALEINQGFARHYPDAKTTTEKREYASTTLWFTAAAYGLFVCVALMCLRPLTALILHSPVWEQTIGVAVVAMGVNGGCLSLQNQLRWQLKPLAYITAGLTYVCLSVGAGVWIIAWYHTGVVGIFYGQIIGAVVAGCCAWFMGRHNYGFFFKWSKCKEMLAFSFPLIPASISVIVAAYVDRIAIQNMMTLNDVGIYSVGFRVASVANVVMAGIYFSLTPLIYEHYRKTSTPGELAAIFTYFLCGTLPIIMGMAMFSREILRLFATPPYYSAWVIIPILSIASILSKMYIFAPGLDIEKKTKKIALINIVAAVINAALNILLIPHFGIAGSALATLISAAVLFYAYMRASQKLYPIPYKWGKIVKACIASILVIILSYYLPVKTNYSDWLALSGKLLTVIIASILIFWFLFKKKASFRNS
jgi:O-antigen/teichoic acid export membrane protein